MTSLLNTTHLYSLLPSACIRQRNPRARFVWCNTGALLPTRPQRDEVVGHDERARETCVRDVSLGKSLFVIAAIPESDIQDTSSPGITRSARPFPGYDHRHGAHENVEVHPERPVLGVVDIGADPLVEG